MGTYCEYVGLLDKVGKVFAVMSHDSQTIALPSFISQCQFLRLRLTTETLTDIFQSNATSTRGTLTFTEFKDLAEQYPTMLESLFARLRDFEEDERQQQRLKDLRDELGKCHAAEQNYTAHHRDALRGLTEARAAIEDAQARCRSARENEEEMQAGLADAVEATKRRRERCIGVNAALSDLAGEEATRRADRDSVTREGDQALAGLQTAEAEAAELHRKWQLQLDVVRERMQAVDAVREKEERLRLALDDVARRIQIAQSAVVEAEHQLSHAMAQEEAAATRQLQAHSTAQAAQEALGRAAEGTQPLEHQASTIGSYIESCRVQSQELAKRYEELERHNTDFNAQRLKQSVEMSSLLEEEVAIRKQRNALENREARLRAGVILKQSELERHKVGDAVAPHLRVPASPAAGSGVPSTYLAAACAPPLRVDATPGSYLPGRVLTHSPSYYHHLEGVPVHTHTVSPGKFHAPIES